MLRSIGSNRFQLYRYILLLGGATAFVMVAVGCGSGGGGNTPPIIQTGSIMGEVRFDNSFGSAEMDQVKVFIKEDPTKSVFPNSSGRYSITNLPVGNYTVIVEVFNLDPGLVIWVEPGGGEYQVQVKSGIPTVNVNFNIIVMPGAPDF